MKKSIIAGFLLLCVTALGSAGVFASGEDGRSVAEQGVINSAADSPNPSYIIKWEYPDDFEGEVMSKIVFPDGSETDTNDGYVLFMYNGSFVSQNGILTAGSTVYAPLGKITGGADGSFGVYQQNDTFAQYPIVWIETSDMESGKAMSKSASLSKAEAVINELFDELAEEYGESFSMFGQGGVDYINGTRESVSDISITGEISRYWILSDSRENEMMLCDKYTGDLFVFRGNYSTYWIEPLTVDSLYYVFFTE